MYVCIMTLIMMAMITHTNLSLFEVHKQCRTRRIITHRSGLIDRKVRVVRGSLCQGSCAWLGVSWRYDSHPVFDRRRSANDPP